MFTPKRLVSTVLFAALLLPAGCASTAQGPYVTKVDNGVARKVPAACVSEEKLLAAGCVKTTDTRGDAVYICNKAEMPEGPIAGRDNDDNRRNRQFIRQRSHSGHR